MTKTTKRKAAPKAAKPRRRAKTSPASLVAPTKAAKKPGVIATITELMSRKDGATIDQMAVVLVKKFPDRDPTGMGHTVRVQTSRQGAKRDDDGRYKLPKRG